MKTNDLIYMCVWPTVALPMTGEVRMDWVTTFMGVVYPWAMDHMDHMNVRFYTGKFDEATWRFLAGLGLTPAYLQENDRGMVAARQETEYKQEVVAGEMLTIRSRALEIGTKSVTFTHEMTNAETGDVVAKTKLVGVHLDRTARTAVPFPDGLPTTQYSLRAS